MDGKNSVIRYITSLSLYITLHLLASIIRSYRSMTIKNKNTFGSVVVLLGVSSSEFKFEYGL